MCRFISEVQYYFQSLSVVIFTSKAYHESSFLTIFNTTAHHSSQKDSCFFFFWVTQPARLEIDP